ncbi:hypothetical protein ACNSOL_12245 (plasmid) [Aliarcobacter lanthieri]|uniref:hypothetical protein n=1 Tax=Aliarcobacter lanthieri TaxID=1355374 RepID=UPI003AAF34AB
MLRLIIIFLMYVQCFSETGNNLKFPDKQVYDFTYESKETKKERTVERILVEIGKSNLLERRESSIYNCNKDMHGNEYCPSNLVKADSYWDYDSGFSVAGVGSVVDYVSKESTINIEYSLQSSVSCTATWNRIADLEKYCKNLREGGFANWRLPLIEETTAYSDTGVPSCGNTWTATNTIGPKMNTETNVAVNKLVWRNKQVSYDGNVAHLTDNGEHYGRYGYYYKARCVRDAEIHNIIKTCPQGYTETTGIEISKGECKKTIEYTYYNYLCNNSKNEQGYNYTPTNSGGNCNKIDTNNTTANPELTTPCNNSTPPTNNCKREGFKCNTNERKAVYVDNEWRCSPYLCNGDMRCGYGTCKEGTKASKDKYQDLAYHPLKYLYAKKCNSGICDYVENKDISYCEREACPQGEDIIQQDGRCYKIECPKGTYLSGTKCLESNY